MLLVPPLTVVQAAITPAPIVASFEWFRREAGKWPYSYGGGHPGFEPSEGESGIGYDCSGWASAGIHAGGFLHSSYALDTHEFQDWGFPGAGEWVTVWVIDNPEIEHMVLHFTIPGREHHWTAADHRGTICGWQESFDPAGYTPRCPGIPT